MTTVCEFCQFDGVPAAAVTTMDDGLWRPALCAACALEFIGTIPCNCGEQAHGLRDGYYASDATEYACLGCYDPDREPDEESWDDALGAACSARESFNRDMRDAGRGHLVRA